MVKTIGIVMGVLLGLGGAMGGSRAKSAEPSAKPVRARTVESAPLAAGVPYAASIKPASQVDLAFRVGGYVREILQVPGPDGRRRHLQEDDRVARGAVLARIKEADTVTRRDQARAQLTQAEAAREQARAQLVQAESSREQSRAQIREMVAAADQAVAQETEARASLEQAALDFDRATQLFAREILSKSEYDAAKARNDTAVARLDAARAQVDRARASAERAQLQLEGAHAAVEAARAQGVAAVSQIEGARARLDETQISVEDMFGVEGRMARELLPYGIYTVPEISLIGRTEEALSADRLPYEAGVAPYDELAKGQMLGDEIGFLKLLFHRESLQLLGVHAIGEGASELIHIGQAVLALGATVEYFRDTVFNYPTLAEAYKVAALDGLNKL